MIVFQFLIEIVFWNCSYSCEKVSKNYHFENNVKKEKTITFILLQWYLSALDCQGRLIKSHFDIYQGSYKFWERNDTRKLLKVSYICCNKKWNFWSIKLMPSIITIELSFLRSCWTILNKIILRSSILSCFGTCLVADYNKIAK